MRILGIDPGSTLTGYGVVECRGSRVVHRTHGCLPGGRGKPIAERLARIQAGLVAVIEAEAPTLAVVERAFVSANPKTALVLGQARGVALAAVGAVGMPVEEVTPGEIKQAVVGSGSATKAQVQAMVTRLLSLPEAPASDAADALAAALCRAHQGALGGLDVRRSRAARGRSRSRAARFVLRSGR